MYKVRFYCIDGAHHVYVEQAVIDPNVTCPTHPESDVKGFVVLKDDKSAHCINKCTYLNKDEANEVSAVDAKDAVDKKHSQNTDTILTTDGTTELFNAGWLKRNLLAEDGFNIQIDEIRARDGDGLKLYDDGGNGIFVEDGGKVGIGTINPSQKLDVAGNVLVEGLDGFDFAGETATLYLGDTGTYFKITYGDLAEIRSYNGIKFSDQDGGTGFVTFQDGRIGIGIIPGAKLDVNSNMIRLRNAKTPASASDTGYQGSICWDSNYVYICVATDTWKRSALSTW